MDFELSTPEAEGIASTAVLGFVTTAEEKIDALHSFVLLRHGKLVAQGWWAPYGPAQPHELYSLSKNFTSTAVGMAIDAGLLSLDDTVLSFFPDEAPDEPSQNLAAMRVRDLLSMVSGHQEDTLPRLFEGGDDNLVRAFLALPVEHKPGTHFVYNSGNTYVLSAIVQQVTGSTLMEYLQPRLFAPLGIEGATWRSSSQGVNFGGFGLRMRTRDIASLGQLYLQRGLWNGQQLLSAAWVAQASARQVSNGSNPSSDWEQGYGYQFWRCRHDIYRGDGAFGQYCIVMPEQDAVLAITGGVSQDNLQRVLDVVWETLLPAFGAAPLPAAAGARRRLEQKLASLSLPMPQGQPGSPLAARVSGKTYRMPANEAHIESVGLDLGPDGAALRARIGGEDYRILCGNGVWASGLTALGANGVQMPVSASGAWTSADTYAARVHFHSAAPGLDLRFRYAGDQLHFTSQPIGFSGSDGRLELVGPAR